MDELEDDFEQRVESAAGLTNTTPIAPDDHDFDFRNDHFFKVKRIAEQGNANLKK